MFKKFLNSLKTPQNASLIETIQKGYKALQEESAGESKKIGGFLKTTGDKSIDSKIKQIIEMTPDEYLKQAYEITDGKFGGSFEVWLASNLKDASVQKKYAEDMIKGDKFPIPYIDKANGSQDGRNRAIAAKLAGEKTIPVGIVPELTQNEKIANLEKLIDESPKEGYTYHRAKSQLTDLRNKSRGESKD